jgi:hypothetical protein
MAGRGTDLGRLVCGDALLHTDIRSDNLLLTPDGGVVVLDWGWTCNGAPWLDDVLFALTLPLKGGADAEVLVRAHPLTRDVPPPWIDSILLTSIAHWWLESQLLESPAMPGARASQRAYADATIRWLRRRATG